MNADWWLAEAVVAGLVVERVVKKAGANGEVGRILSLLVCLRVVWPCSKKATVERVTHLLGGPATMDLTRVYRGLAHIAGLAVELQQAASTGLGRSTTALGTVDYDVTNYFFLIDQADENPPGKTAGRGEATRQRGHSKENRPDPIIQLGLFLAAKGIPVSYRRLFDPNVPDTSTLPAVFTEFKTSFGCDRVRGSSSGAIRLSPSGRRCGDARTCCPIGQVQGALA